MSSRTIQERVVRSVYLASFSPATIKVGVPDAVRNYIEERRVIPIIVLTPQTQ